MAYPEVLYELSLDFLSEFLEHPTEGENSAPYPDHLNLIMLHPEDISYLLRTITRTILLLVNSIPHVLAGTYFLRCPTSTLMPSSEVHS